MKLQGWDLALNHSGFVEVDHKQKTGGVKVTNYWFVTSAKALLKQIGDHGIKLDLPTKTKANKESWDPELYGIHRLYLWKLIFDEHLDRTKPDMVCIEHYALNANRDSYAKGELGGMARMACYERGIPFRLIDPTSLKMFMAHNGRAEKPQMEKAVKDRFCVDFSDVNSKKSKSREPSEDLCDAFSLAYTLAVELEIRAGKYGVQDLHPKEIQLFNRVTAFQPVNILARDILCLDSLKEMVG